MLSAAVAEWVPRLGKLGTFGVNSLVRQLGRRSTDPVKFRVCPPDVRP